MMDNASSKQKGLSKEEVQARIDAKEREISGRARVIEHETKFLGILAKERIDLLKEQAKNNALAVGGGIAGGGLLLKLLLGGRDSDEGKPARRHELTEAYSASLSRDVEDHLNEGETLQDALLYALRDRAPLLLENPTRHVGSFWGGLLGLGLMAGAAFGANYVAEYITGRSVIDLVKDQLGGNGDYEPPVEPAYAPVHGTAGAEMPDPEPFGPVSPSDVPTQTGPVIDESKAGAGLSGDPPRTVAGDQPGAADAEKA